MNLVSYLMTLSSDEERREAINALSKEQKSALVASLCGTVNELAQTIVENKDEIWQTGELPSVPCCHHGHQSH